MKDFIGSWPLAAGSWPKKKASLVFVGAGEIRRVTVHKVLSSIRTYVESRFIFLTSGRWPAAVSQPKVFSHD
jgi:hypothetical protein